MKYAISTIKMQILNQIYRKKIHYIVVIIIISIPPSMFNLEELFFVKNARATTVHHDGYEQYGQYWEWFQLGQSNYNAKTRGEGGGFKGIKITSSIFNFKRPLGVFRKNTVNDAWNRQKQKSIQFLAQCAIIARNRYSDRRKGWMQKVYTRKNKCHFLEIGGTEVGQTRWEAKKDWKPKTTGKLNERTSWEETEDRSRKEKNGERAGVNDRKEKSND